MVRRVVALLILCPVGVAAGRWAFSQGYGGALAYATITLLGPIGVGLVLNRRPLAGAAAFSFGAFAGMVWAHVSFCANHGVDLARDLSTNWSVVLVVFVWTAV